MCALQANSYAAPQRPSDKQAGGVIRQDIEFTTATTQTEQATTAASEFFAGQMGSAAQAIPGAVEEPAQPAVPVGDDAYPSGEEIERSPYFKPSKGESVAFVPPPIQKTMSERSEETGRELRAVLGEEVFNLRINIVTPPDEELANIIRLLAERAQLNFIYAEGVIKGRVTLNLKDVPLGVALQSLLAAHDLALVREGANVFRIVRRQDIQQTAVETKTIYVKVNWVPAQTIADTLKDIMGAGVGTKVGEVKAHKESNTVIITDTPPNVALMRDIIAQLDVPQKQVMIEARLVELLINNGRQLGSATTIERPDKSGNSRALGTLGDNAEHKETVNKVVIGEDGKPTIVTEEITVPATPVNTLVSNLLVGGGAPSFSFGKVISILGKDFDVAGTLDALESRRIANILANPKVITLDNETAQISITRDNPYIEAQQGVGQQAVAASVKFKQSGVELLVTPNITDNGYVRMKLQPRQEIYAGDFKNPTTGSNIPIIDKREALTNVIVKDEDTVVLGGLREIDSSDARSQVPWLGQVPVIGWFYKGSSRGFLKNDLMLFVTPHIIKTPVMTAAENYRYSRLDAHWDLPDYFFDDSIELRERRHRGEVDGDPRAYSPEPVKVPELSKNAKAE
ncbi:Type IV pilus biogenesis protein PilQ [Candidatus Sumerlaea chitinivorans]|jgi:type IV pilus assembly protein PilQ|uniref:Type IV pilus biogenesis protein PilQ n=1 Tax=Sumerlaea chitinivorans TaxID=2250252 RepID=A0A2Z4Y689_SUMC1|nr:Type IV pilus biogenesis protein PilQ [Candidatus Sumerlaea chitinivorans]